MENNLYDEKIEISFTVRMEPVVWGRVMPVNMGKFTKMVTPEETRNAQKLFRSLSAEDRPSVPLQGPLLVESRYYMTRPKSVPVKKRPYPCVGKDLDNFTKLMFDAMNTNRAKKKEGQKIGDIIYSGFWEDDSQVCGQLHWKRYADPGQERIEVTISTL